MSLSALCIDPSFVQMIREQSGGKEPPYGHSAATTQRVREEERSERNDGTEGK